jgi:hypothetical protein
LGSAIIELVDRIREQIPCLALDFISQVAAPPHQALPMATVFEDRGLLLSRGLVKVGLPELIIDCEKFRSMNNNSDGRACFEHIARRLVEDPEIINTGRVIYGSNIIRLSTVGIGENQFIEAHLQPQIAAEREAYFYVSAS